jgi:hypothetical protein
MNVVLWIVAGLLALAFLFAGVTKVARPQDQLAEQMGWVEDFSPGMVKLIGALEVLAAIGLIVPPLVGVAPVLAPLAAVGLVLLMIGAAVTHGRRREMPMVLVNVVLLALAAVVAIGRFGPESFSA